MPELKLSNNWFYFIDGSFVDLLYVMNGSELEAAVEKLHGSFEQNVDDPASKKPLWSITQAIRQRQESISERLKFYDGRWHEFVVAAQRIGPLREDYAVLLRIRPDNEGRIAGDDKITRVAGMTSQYSGVMFNRVFQKMEKKLLDGYESLRNLATGDSYSEPPKEPEPANEEKGGIFTPGVDTIEISSADECSGPLQRQRGIREIGAPIFEFRLCDYFGSDHPLYGTKAKGLIQVWGGQVTARFLQDITNTFPALVYGETLIGDPDREKDSCYRSVFIAAKEKRVGTEEDTFAGLAEIVFYGKRKHLAFTNDTTFAEIHKLEEKGSIVGISIKHAQKMDSVDQG